MKTRAALFHAVGAPFEVAEIDLDEPGPRDVVVRMASMGICGTDLHQVRGEFRRPTPIVLGHEGSGVVEAVGDEVTLVRPGEDVILSWAPSCRDCADCRRGRPAACTRLHEAIGAGTLIGGSTGMSRAGEPVYRGTATGCFAERIVVDERVALPTGGGVPLREAALLGCAALTGVGAVLNVARIAAGSSVVVIGAGAVGQFVVQGARLAGASIVVSVDPVEGRRDQAVRLGATHAAAPETLGAVLGEVAPEGVDVAFDAVGHPATTADALAAARAGGACVMVGIPAVGSRLDLDPAQFLRREKWLTGTMYGSEDPAVALPVLLEHVRAGRLDLASLVGPVFALDDIDEAVEASLSGAAGRVLLQP